MLNFRNLSVSFTFILIVALCSSCYEKQEGCLDITATNYDFGADKACEDCCILPNLKISMIHEWGDTTLMHDSLYHNVNDQYIQILDAKFYLSDFTLIDDNNEVTIEDELIVESITGQESTIYDNIVFLQTSRFNYTIGSFAYPSTYDKLRLTFGINGNYIAADDSESFIEDDSFFDNITYEHINFQMTYVIDTMAMDTLVMNLKGIEWAQTLNLEGGFEIPLGRDASIPLKAQYQSLFSDTDFSKLDETSELAKIKSNFSNFISIKE